MDSMVMNIPLRRTRSMVMDIPVNRPVLVWYGHGYTIKRTRSMVLDILVNRPGLGLYGHEYTIWQNWKYGNGFTSKQIWS